MSRRLALPAFALAVGFLLALPLYAGARTAEATTGEHFFIISSVDLKKQQIVLKRPTEVTELIRVTDKTVYLDEQGKPIPFKDLRAGDTVFVTLASSGAGTPIAVRIRKGIMTVEELHRRYLQFE
jgi:hypothetical protein